MKKLIITAAINGGITTRDKNPNVPYTPKEIAQSVYDSWNAGAAVAHIHARNPDGTPAYDAEIWGEIVHEIRARCDILINLSTSGLNLPAGLPKNTAWNHLQFHPDIASFNCGSVNHGEKAFINPPALARELAMDLRAAGVRAEVEVYNEGILSEAIRHAESGILETPHCFCFAMGIPGAVEATYRNLLHLVQSLPQGAIWSALALGKNQLPINIHTMLLGGHVRTGFEDNVYYRKGELAWGNAQFVERLVRLAGEVGRDVATPNDARQILQLRRTEPATVAA